MAVLLAPRPGTGIDGAFLPISGHLWGSENLHLSVTTWLSSQAQRMTGEGGGADLSPSHTELPSQEGLSCSLDLHLITQETSCDGIIRPSTDLWGADCRTKRAL